MEGDAVGGDVGDDEFDSPFCGRSLERRRNLYLDQTDGGAFLSMAVGFVPVESCSTSPPVGLGFWRDAAVLVRELTTATCRRM